MPDLTVQTLRQTLAQASWQPERLMQRLAPTRSLRPWLTDRGSLTQNLRRLCSNLSVAVMDEGDQRPTWQEAMALKLGPERRCWVRTVRLHCHGQTWVYARTVIPDLRPGNPWYSLKQLGNQPLGEVLFNTPNLVRSGFQLARTQANGFARQSLFSNADTPLLLTEVLTDTLAARLTHGPDSGA
ncbi:chorismate--pyruvate lyase family protein [Hydrogenovibrio halophilus]|uniref:chorismate--pyruvate lyase family protein n=1 Tax=Hydrogenovibrio halophilus TaxID=373391 RepID=UPI00037036D8|nr:chorismate lyase [Hydrogenovibrio halophilus]